MKNKDFLEFLTQGENPPINLKESSQTEILLSFRGHYILKKFLAYQVLGAVISLAFCPQFGLSFFVDGHGFTHQLRMIGDWACALFCGSLFLSAGTMIALLSMKGEELSWILKRKKLFLIFIPSVLWSCLMFLNLSLKLPNENYTYHLSWIFSGIAIQFLWLKARNYLFLNRPSV
jgi:hypothetical protein